MVQLVQCKRSTPTNGNAKSAKLSGVGINKPSRTLGKFSKMFQADFSTSITPQDPQVVREIYSGEAMVIKAKILRINSDEPQFDDEGMPRLKI